MVVEDFVDPAEGGVRDAGAPVHRVRVPERFEWGRRMLGRVTATV
jgi:hypothetical protein